MSFLRLLEPPQVPTLRPLEVQVVETPPPAVVPAPPAPMVERRPVPPAPVRDRRPLEPSRSLDPALPASAPQLVPSPEAASPAPTAVARPTVASGDAPRSAPAAPPPPVASSGPVEQEAATGQANESAPSATRAAVAPSATPGPRDGTLGGGNAGARAIYQPRPEIPETLRHRSIEITTVARFRVAANGSAQVELTEPTGDPDLNRAVLDALRRWRFFPAIEAGKPVASTLDIRIPISVK